MDLPIPGSPPTRIADPRTMPPRTRSISAMPVRMRSPSSASIASMGCGAPENEKDARPDAPAPPAAVSRNSSSTKVFHSPQPGHLPNHFGES